jgi:glycosyltransferase involved in cell wall biosynthesis
MNKPLISIIIPTYNRANLINHTLDSILAQTYTNWECIIVDDGSTDNTVEILNKFANNDLRFKIVNRPKNLPKGANSCRNFGFEKSLGNYITWFDSDDLMHRLCIEKRVVKIEKGKFDFVSCELTSFISNRSNSRLLKNNYEGNLLANYFCGELAFYTPGPLWSKGFLLKNKLKFDLTSKVLNDWIFNLNALFLTNNFFLIKEPLVFYREHDNSISGGLANGDVKHILSEFNIRKSMLKEFKTRKLVDRNIAIFYINRLTKLLRVLLLSNSILSYEVYLEIVIFKYKKSFFIFEKIKITLGYILYKIFKKGYRLLTPTTN